MTFAAIENYARPALKPFARYLNYGVSDPDKRQERGAALLNFVSLAAVFSNTGFAVIYLLIDPERYFPFIAALLAFSLIWLLTPLLHRFGTLAAGTYLWATAAVGLSTYALIAGADAGLQYFLLAGPGILIMILGSRPACARLHVFFRISRGFRDHRTRLPAPVGHHADAGKHGDVHLHPVGLDVGDHQLHRRLLHIPARGSLRGRAGGRT